MGNAFGLGVPQIEFIERETQDVARGCFEEPGKFEDALGELFVITPASTDGPSPKKPNTAWVALPKSASDKAFTLDSGIAARRAT